jgi:Fe-S-cluster containining protein
MWKGPAYDWQECGACCINPGIFGGEAYVYLTKEEGKRMKRPALSVEQVPGEAHLGSRIHAGGTSNSICVAFKGKVGGPCGCGIYAGSPSACRQFQVGGPECQEARSGAGLSV